MSKIIGMLQMSRVCIGKVIFYVLPPNHGFEQLREAVYL